MYVWELGNWDNLRVSRGQVILAAGEYRDRENGYTVGCIIMHHTAVTCMFNQW